MRRHSLSVVALAAATFLLATVSAAFAHQGSLHHGTSKKLIGPGGSAPGTVLWTYYETTYLGFLCSSATPAEGCNHEGAGDSIIRLINPNGSANEFLSGLERTVCAMIYVFDDDEEMAECCGCPLSSAKIATFSVEKDLTSNWGLPGPGPEGLGVIGIVAASQNASLVLGPNSGNGLGCDTTQTQACNSGCDPTNFPGYTVLPISNLLGSITHSQVVQAGPTDARASIFGLSEIGLFDDADGDVSNLVYLQNQCGALVGNSSHHAICNCPAE